MIYLVLIPLFIQFSIFFNFSNANSHYSKLHQKYTATWEEFIFGKKKKKKKEENSQKQSKTKQNIVRKLGVRVLRNGRIVCGNIMADDSRETDSTSIDSAINELAERKNGKQNRANCTRLLDFKYIFLEILVSNRV